MAPPTSRVLNLFRIAADACGQSRTSRKAALPLAHHQPDASCSSIAPAPTKPICSPAPGGGDQDHHSLRHQRSARRRPFAVRRPARLCRQPARRPAITATRRWSATCAVLRLLNTRARRSIPSCCASICATTRSTLRPAISPFPKATRSACTTSSTSEMSQLVALAGGGGDEARQPPGDRRMLSNRDRRKAGAAAPDPGPDRQRFPRRRVQLARLSLLQMVDGQVLARRDERAARDQRDPARSARSTPEQKVFLPAPAATSSRWCATMASM